MAFDRSQIKGSISNKEQSDPQLSEKFDEAHKTHAELTKIRNAHELAKMKTERGLIGCIFGSWRNVPMFIALIAVLSGIYTFYSFMMTASEAEAANVKFWSESAKVSLAFAGTALGYIFGRGNTG